MFKKLRYAEISHCDHFNETTFVLEAREETAMADLFAPALAAYKAARTVQLSEAPAKKDVGRDFMAEKMARKVAEMPDVDPDIDLAALRAKAKAGAAGKTDEEKKALGLLYDKSSAAAVREESEEDEDDESCNMGGDPFEGM